MNPETYFMGSLIGAVAVLLPIIIYIENKARRQAGKQEGREIYPQPLQVASAPKYVTIQDCEKLHAMQDRASEAHLEAATERFRSIVQEELRAIEATHTTRTDALREELSNQIGGVHRRVDLIFEKLNNREKK